MELGLLLGKVGVSVGLYYGSAMATSLRAFSSLQRPEYCWVESEVIPKVRASLGLYGRSVKSSLRVREV
jgi:hypothetical protein